MDCFNNRTGHRRHLRKIGRANSRSSGRSITGRSWPQYREEHLTYLSRPGIETLFGRVGLEAVSVRSTRKAITPAYVYGQALAYPLPVVTPIARFAYERLPIRGLGPFRVWFGEMTVVARRDPTSVVASP